MTYKDFSVDEEQGARQTVRWRVATGPGVPERTNGQTEGTSHRAPGHRQTPAPNDKRRECIQSQARCLDHTSKERETDALHKLEEMSQAPRRKECFHPECPQYCAHLDKVAAEFKQRSGELDVMDHVAPFVSNPFRPLDVKQVAAKLQYFLFQLGVGMDWFAKGGFEKDKEL